MSVLVVDLDGTLIRSDTTYELLILCLRWAPLLLIPTLGMMFLNKSRGKRWLTQKLGQHVDPQFLPYEEAVLSLIKEHNEDGGQAELVSGTDELIVKRIADHLGIFARSEGSRPGLNLTNKRKAQSLTDRHQGDFIYVGNSSQDIAVWKASKGGYGVRAPSKAFRLKNQAKQPIKVEKLISQNSELPALLKGMRLHQWAKNLLMAFVPALFIASLTVENWIDLAVGFVAFGMMASGTYLLNDLFDIPDDRAHRTKRNRPFAAGTLSVPLGAMAMLALIVGSMAAALWVGPSFFLVLAIYAFTTISYSFRLKRVPVLDVVILASLFTIRVVAGGVIVDHFPTPWLIYFIGFIFLSLALAKRYVEVSKLAVNSKAAGRGYLASDANFLLAFGGAASLASVLSLVIYGLLAESKVIESHWVILVMATIMMGWTMRLWLIAARGQLDDDPVLFAVKDKQSLIAMMIIGLLIILEVTRGTWHNLF